MGWGGEEGIEEQEGLEGEGSSDGDAQSAGDQGDFSLDESKGLIQVTGGRCPAVSLVSDGGRSGHQGLVEGDGMELCGFITMLAEFRTLRHKALLVREVQEYANVIRK